MRNILIKKLPREHRALWEVSKQGAIEDEHMFKHLQKRVSDERKKLRDRSGDPYLRKLKQFGNEGQWGTLKLQELYQKIYDHKIPSAENSDWVSVEIELMFRKGNHEKEFIQFVRRNALSQFVTVKTDGSIHPSHDEKCPNIEDSDAECECGVAEYIGKELVVSFRYGDWKVLELVCSELNRLKATVNKTCGLHVHFDCRHLTSRKVTNLGKKIASAVPALKQILPPSRSNNKFCAATINKHVTHGRGSEDRYSFVNLQAYHRHKTLEIRGHSGTTDFTKIANWIRILKTIMGSKNLGEIKSVSALINSFEFEKDLVNYITTRYDKFRSAKPQTDDVSEDNTTIAETHITSSLGITVLSTGVSANTVTTEQAS